MGSCRRLAFCLSAFMSRSVTFRDKKPVFLLQIKTFASGGNGDDGPFV